MTGASLVEEAGRLKLVLWGNLEGWGGEGGGRGSGCGDAHTHMGDSC